MSLLAGSFRALHFAVRLRVLAKPLGQMLLLVAALTALPAAAAWLGGHSDVALRFLAVMLLLGILGLAGARVDCDGRIQSNEALVISALVFVISALALAIPIAGYGIAPLDAVFEAISGVTTTGLTTLGTVEGRPRSLLFTRAWLQWVGGLGVVVLALAFSLPSGAAAQRLGFDEREVVDTAVSTRGHARRILIAYLGLTGFGLALCALMGLRGFEAVTYTLAAVSTGGFAPYDASLAALPAPARSAICLLSFAGAVSFSLYYRASLRAALRDMRLWTLIALTLFVGALFAVVSPGVPGVQVGWQQAAWTAVSAQTTTGFSTLPIAEVSAGGKLVLIGAMLIGGELGSTAGGLKITRLLILTQLVLVRVLHASMPRTSHLAPQLNGARVEDDEVHGAAALALAFAGVIFASWLVFLFYGHDPLDALFDVISAVGTVGLSAGTTGPELEPALKAVLCLDMLMGRVELFAFFVLLFPGTWIGRRRAAQ